MISLDEGSKHKGYGSQYHSSNTLDFSNRPRRSTEDATTQTTGSLDGATEETRTAGACNVGIKSSLATQDGAAAETRSIGTVRLEADVCSEDITRAGGAKIVGGKVGLEEKEWEVGRAVSGGVGDECSFGAAGIGRRLGEGTVKIILDLIGGQTGGRSCNDSIVEAAC